MTWDVRPCAVVSVGNEQVCLELLDAVGGDQAAVVHDVPAGEVQAGATCICCDLEPVAPLWPDRSPICSECREIVEAYMPGGVGLANRAENGSSGNSLVPRTAHWHPPSPRNSVVS